MQSRAGGSSQAQGLTGEMISLPSWEEVGATARHGLGKSSGPESCMGRKIVRNVCFYLFHGIYPPDGLEGKQGRTPSSLSDRWGN